MYETGDLVEIASPGSIQPISATVTSTGRRWAIVTPNDWHGQWDYPYRVEISTGRLFGRSSRHGWMPTGKTAERVAPRKALKA